MNHESEKVRLLVVIEEAHSILPENVSPEARDYAKEASKLINRITREKKKYGCIVFIVTQSNADFRSEARVVREMIGLRLIHCSTDGSEHEYVGRYVSREFIEVVKQCKAGEAVVASSGISPTKVCIRPPFSSVKEISDEEVQKINRSYKSKFDIPNNQTIRQIYEFKLTERESQALEIIKTHFETHDVPILATELEKRMKIRGGTRQRLLEGLVEKKKIKTVVMKGRGKPLGLIPLT